MDKITNKKILIFGGAGSLGQTLIKRLHTENSLLICSRDEAKHWAIKNTLKKNCPIFRVGDIRDRNRTRQLLLELNPHIVIMASALKQVDTCELCPYESVQTNLLGINNILESVSEVIPRLSDLQSVLMVSTDKACAPVNVYGMCKAISERIASSYSSLKHLSHIKFVTTRYGNVLDSKGSIIPLFRSQINQESHLTVTHPNMTRFLMTLDESVDLIITALTNGKSGELWVPKIKSMKIIDLATIFSKAYQKEIKISGIRPGEKMHEDLVCEPESIRTRDVGDHYVIEPPHFSYSSKKINNIFSYNSSQDILSKSELQEYLESLDLLRKEINRPHHTLVSHE